MMLLKKTEVTPLGLFLLFPENKGGFRI